LAEASSTDFAAAFSNAEKNLLRFTNRIKSMVSLQRGKAAVIVKGMGGTWHNLGKRD